MSFLAKSPRLPSLSPAEAQQASSYKEADPVPLGYGRDVFGSHWLCQPYDWRTQRAGEVKPEWQYCSIAAAYRIGVVDFVGKVFVDGKEIANLDYTFGAEDYHDFTLNPSLALGQAWTLRVYRGTETQTADAGLAAGTGQAHPPYRGICYAVWVNIDLGAGVTSLPSLGLELGVHTPAVGTYAAGDSHPYGVNPFAATYALCRESKGGLDLDADLLDATHWGDQATALEATGVGGRTGDLVKCHPIWSGVKDAAAVLSEVLAYVDAFLYADVGQLKVGWFPNAAPAGALPEIAEADLDEKPSGGTFADWNQAATSVVVIFKDFARNYAEAPASYQVPALRETGVLTVPARSDRPFIHDAAQAAKLAAEQSLGVAPDSGVNLSVLKSRAVHAGGAPLLPGDLVNWDYGPHALDLPCRVVSRRIRSGAASDLLALTRERGAFPTPYVAAVDARVLPTPVDPGEITAGTVRLWFLPAPLALRLDAAAPRQVAALVDRASREIAGALLSLSPSGAAPWEQLLDQRFFVAKCLATNGGISSGATTLRVTSASVDFARFAAQSVVAQLDDTLLLLIEDELVSVSTIAVVSAGVYDLGLLRARQGTAAAAHADGVAAWLFLRAELAAVPHAEFYRVRDGANVYDSAIATKHFKLALFTVDDLGDPKPDDPGLSLVLPDLAASETLAYTVVLTNEAHTVACAADGTVNAGQLGAGGTARTTVAVFRGATALAAVASGPNSDQYSIAIGDITATTATKESNDTIRCDTLTADTGTIEVEVTVAGAIFIPKIFTLTKAIKGVAGAPGTAGLNNAVVFIYKRAASAPTLPSATTTFTFATGVLTGLDGGWTQAVPAADGNPLYVSAATASSATATDTIAAGEWAAASILAQDGAAGAAGLNSASVFIYKRAASAPTLPSASTTYTFATGVLTGLNNGWTQAVPAADGNPLYVSIATAVASTATDTIAAGEWSAVAILAQDGATGATGAVGPGIVYRGAYNAAVAYYQTATRRDVVSYSGAYYLTNNVAKNGLTTWGLPSGGDWAAFGATFSSVATALLLAEDATILKTLVMGDGATADAGVIRSAGATAFATGIGYWFNPRNGSGQVEARFGNPAGQHVSIIDGVVTVNGSITTTTGTVEVGAGATKTLIDSTHINFGNGGTTNVAIGANSGAPYVELYSSTRGLITLALESADLPVLQFENVAGDTLFNIRGGVLNWGGGAVTDTNLYRSAANRLKTDDSLEVSGTIWAGGSIAKASSDGWTPMLYDGDNNISFKWDAGALKVKIDATEYTVTIT